MICEICGNEYSVSCAHCARRIKVWGESGTIALYELAKRKDDISAEEIMAFVNTYYQGTSVERSDKSNVLKISLRIAGYKGKFVGRIHKNNNSYLSVRRREHENGRRWRLRKDVCEICGSTSNLMLHHIVPLSWGGISSKDNVITLCETCHMEVHKNLREHLNRELLLKYLLPHREEIESFARASIPKK